MVRIRNFGSVSTNSLPMREWRGMPRLTIGRTSVRSPGMPWQHQIYRSGGVPRTGLFHPWARWGRGPVAGNSSMSSSRNRVGKRGVGVRARHTFTRQRNKHPTRKQVPDKETSTRKGNKHSTRKQAFNEETSIQQGNRHLFPDVFRDVLLCCTCWTLISSVGLRYFGEIFLYVSRIWLGVRRYVAAFQRCGYIM